jgi:tetratricopeptide (TPR) repeat protein
MAVTLLNRGSVFLQMGDLPNSEKDVRQALSISQIARVESTSASAFGALGDIQMARGNFADARKSYEESMKRFKEMGDKGDIAGSWLSLAKLTLEEGNAIEAANLARQAIKEFQAEKLVDSEGDARNTLARSLISEGNLANAQEEVETAANLGVQDQATKISIAITGARLKARDGKVAEAQKGLDSSLAESTKAKLLGLQFEIRLAEAEIKRSSDPQAAGLSLKSLDRDAKASGFLLFATKAEHLQALQPH